MKKLIFLTVLIFAPILVFAMGDSDWDPGFPKRGNGNTVTFEKPVSPFKKIHISGSAIVYFHESREYRAVVTVDSNLEDAVRIYNQNDTLNIGTKRGRYYFFTKYIVDVYCPIISGVSISGSARFEGKDKISTPSFSSSISGFGKIEGSFECDDFSLSVSGSGDININIVCESVKANITGAAKIVLAGNARDLDINVSGSGDFNSSELCTNNAALQISGSAGIQIWVLDNLRATISGSGRVKYRGNPKVDFRGSGSGRLESV